MGEVAHFQGVDKRSTAYQLLSKLGWQEGQGLGVRKQGIVSHVKVRKKADSSGIGLAQEAAKARDWTLGMAAYDRVLASLKVVASSSQVARVEGSSRKAEANQEKRKKTSQEGEARKARKLKSSSTPREAVRVQNAAIVPKASPALEQIGAAVPPGASAAPLASKVAVTHKGRFKRAIKGKQVNSYSTDDMAAILGGCRQDTGVTAQDASKQQCSPVNVEDAQQDSSACQLQSEAAPTASSHPDAGNGWWAKQFVRAGSAGSAGVEIRPLKPKIAINGFSEGDQANLWQTVTDTQTKSRQGLGQSLAPLKVAGARWSGTKTQIIDSEDDSQDALPEAPAIEEMPAEAAQTVIVPSKRSQTASLRKTESLAETEAVHEETDGQPHSEEIDAYDRRKQMKWRKIAKEILSSVQPQSMRLKFFKSRAWEVAAIKGATDRKQSMKEMLQVLLQSRQFCLSDSAISMA